MVQQWTGHLTKEGLRLWKAAWPSSVLTIKDKVIVHRFNQELVNVIWGNRAKILDKKCVHKLADKLPINDVNFFWEK